MTGLGSSHGYLCSLIVTHFSEENDIWALSQRCAKSGNVTLSVGINLSLADDALIMPVQVFQRIFQCNDMFFLCVINMVNNTRQCSGFTIAGRSGYQNKSLGIIGKNNDAFWNVSFAAIRKFKRNDTDNGRK